eukprot:TRINITY_DN9293_c0_g1_i1.p1 TRINITY_DN9293_c0_g1~~TRINITY_DN9293_c0_g1_i1.p1  ORF type:complete len:970 (+),score=413.44 TRINITY_DN9293_c0_g1_i1:312-3221(+)
MEGYRTKDQDFESYLDDPGVGLIPRALSHLFEKLDAGKTEYTVKASFLEIYNEDIFDLLSGLEDTSKLRLFEDARSKGSVVIQNLQEVLLKSKEDVYDVLTKGAEKRRTSATLMNKHSSRSHSVFMVTVHQKEATIGDELVRCGKLYLVDLAGSENIGRSGAVKDRAREAGNINQSLLTLGRVIQKLVQHEGHIPYRESKLTRLLQDSLGGKTKTSIIATISPAMCNMEETMSTLDYAFHAKNIKNRPEVNQRVTKKAILTELSQEIERLRKDLRATREKSGVYVSEDNYTEMTETLEAQKQELEAMTARMEVLKKELADLQVLYDTTSATLTTTKAELAATARELQETAEALVRTEQALAAVTLERDQTMFIAEQRAKTEVELRSQAEDLVAVAETTTAHVEGLHAKIGRKAAVEAHNVSASQSMQASLDQQLATSKQDLGAFACEQQAALTTAAERMAAYTSSVEDSMAKMAKAVNIAQEQLGQLDRSATSSLGNLRTHSLQQAEATVSQAQGFSQEQSAKMAEYTTGPLQDLLSGVLFQLNTQQERVAAMSSSFQASIQDMSSHVTAFTNDLKTQLGSMQAAFDQALDEQQTTIEATQAQLQQQQAAAQAQLVDNVAGFKQSMTSMLDNWVRQREQQLAQDNQAVAATCSALATATQALQTRAGASMDQAQAAATDFATTATQKASAATMASAASHDAVQAGMQDSQQQVQGVGEHVTQFAAKQAQRGSTFEAALSTELAAYEEASLGQLQSACVAVTQDVGQVTQTIQPIAQEADGVTSASATYEDQALAATTAIKQAVSGTAQRVTGQLDQAQQLVATFVEADMQRDLPTGATPARQTYSYPRVAQLKATEPRDVLLSQFDRKRLARLAEEEEEQGALDQEGGDVEGEEKQHVEQAVEAEAGPSTPMAEDEGEHEQAGVDAITDNGKANEADVLKKENAAGSGIPAPKTRSSMRRKGAALHTVN